MKNIVVFAGPSLTQADKLTFENLVFGPPCEEGDVLRATAQGVDAIGIIDGYFGDRRAVSHKEILYALANGIPVFGAASMGALRAAELDSYGMVGIGKIYQDYRKSVLVDDGDVAVTHGQEELNYIATSLALVDVKATLASLVARRQMSEFERQQIYDYAQSIFFQDRTWDAISRAASSNPEKLKQRLQIAAVNAKRLDAIELLETLNNPDGWPSLPKLPEPPSTVTFAQDLRNAAHQILE